MYLVEPIRDGKFMTDGATSLAIQVYAQKHIKPGEALIFPYICDPHVQIGRFQNPEKEVGKKFLEEHNMPVVRRDTGGGAIYLDNGSVNFCFLLPLEDSLVGDYKQFYAPAIAALKNLGVTEIDQKGRNDLVIHDKKVSGAAMMPVGDRLYGGFSLLLDIDPEAMVKSLTPNRQKLISKGIESVRARVTNIRPHLADKYQDVTNMEFKDLMLKELLQVENLAEAKRYVLTDEDWTAIDQLVEEKYSNWDWVYGQAPQYEYNRSERFDIGTIEVSLSIQASRIDQCKIYGDFFSKGDVSEVEQALIGTRTEREDLLEALHGLEFEQYFGALNPEQLVELILS